MWIFGVGALLIAALLILSGCLPEEPGFHKHDRVSRPESFTWGFVFLTVGAILFLVSLPKESPWGPLWGFAAFAGLVGGLISAAITLANE